MASFISAPSTIDETDTIPMMKKEVMSELEEPRMEVAEEVSHDLKSLVKFIKTELSNDKETPLNKRYNLQRAME